MGFYYDDESNDQLKTWELQLYTSLSSDQFKNYNLDRNDDVVEKEDVKINLDASGTKSEDHPYHIRLFKDFIQSEHDISYTLMNNYGTFSNIIGDAADGLSSLYQNFQDSYSVSKAIWENITNNGNDTIFSSIKNLLEGNNTKNYLSSSLNNSGGILEEKDYIESNRLTAKKYLINYKYIYNGSDITINTLSVTARIFIPSDFIRLKRRLRLLLPLEQYTDTSNNINFLDERTTKNTGINDNYKDSDLSKLIYKRPGKYSDSDKELCTSFNINKLEKTSGYILRIGNKKYNNLIIKDIKIDCSHLKTTGYIYNSENKLQSIQYPTMTTVSITLAPSDPILINDLVNDINDAIKITNISTKKQTEEGGTTTNDSK